MLRTRVMSAAVLLAIIAAPLLLGGWPFFLLIGVIGALAAWEYAALFRQAGFHPSTAVGVALTILLIAQGQVPDLLPLPLALTLVVAGSLLIALWHQSAQPASDWAITLAGVLYIGWLLSLFVRLRALDQGLYWLLLGALAIWAADACAYFGGRAFGRHPWWPRHSPKKTWEGYLIGVAAATLTAGLVGQWLLGLSLLEGSILGVLIGAIAPLGDLAESMIKRQAGAKDASHLIPGHGGILDRIDSLLITMPLVYLWAVQLPQQPF